MSLTVLKPQTKTSLVRWKRLVIQGIGPTWMAPKKERIMIMSSNGCVPCSVRVLLHLWVHSDNAIEERGQSWVSGKLFPWKQMLPRLATSGLVLVNWPEGVMFPGEERTSRTMPKGISDLTRAECSKLLMAMNDTSEHRLYLRSVPSLKCM